MFDAACNGIRGFIKNLFTNPRIPRTLARPAFLLAKSYRLVNRKFVRLPIKHSHHAHFLGLPAYRLHIPPLGYFRRVFALYGNSLPTSASFIRLGCCFRLACRSLKEDVSGRYPFIPSFTLTVLLTVFWQLYRHLTIISVRSFQPQTCRTFLNLTNVSFPERFHQRGIHIMERLRL